MLLQGNTEWLNAAADLFFFPEHEFAAHYRTKTAGMWHKCSKSGEVPASRAAGVSWTRTREQTGDIVRL